MDILFSSPCHCFHHLFLPMNLWTVVVILASNSEDIFSLSHPDGQFLKESILQFYYRTGALAFVTEHSIKHLLKWGRSLQDLTVTSCFPFVVSLNRNLPSPGGHAPAHFHVCLHGFPAVPHLHGRMVERHFMTFSAPDKTKFHQWTVFDLFLKFCLSC